MRVLTVIPLPPGPRGGIEDYASSVLGSPRNRAELEILAPAESSPEVRANFDRNDSPLHLIPARWMFRRLLPSGQSARMRVESLVRMADVVHVHMPCPRLELWTALACVRNAVPLVTTYHMDSIYDGGRSQARSSATGHVLEWLYDSMSARPTLSKARVIVTNSLQYAQESRLLPFFLEKVRAIHQGVNTNHARSSDGGASIRRELASAGGGLVTFLGRLVPYKGVRVLIEAAETLKGDPLTFAVAGKGPLKEELEAEVDRRGLRDQVRFLGFVPDEKVADLLSGSDLVVCPSISLAESTPIVLLEALACGTPIIGTRLGGSEETLPNDGIRGLLVPPRNSVALSTAIRDLIARNPWTPNRPSLWSRTWDDVAADYFRLYEEVSGS